LQRVLRLLIAERPMPLRTLSAFVVSWEVVRVDAIRYAANVVGNQSRRDGASVLLVHHPMCTEGRVLDAYPVNSHASISVLVYPFVHNQHPDGFDPSRNARLGFAMGYLLDVPTAEVLNLDLQLRRVVD